MSIIIYINQKIVQRLFQTENLVLLVIKKLNLLRYKLSLCLINYYLIMSTNKGNNIGKPKDSKETKIVKDTKDSKSKEIPNSKDNKPKVFVEKEFQEVEGGYYEEGFYYTPNGSFWDDKYYYFNKEGFDKHGGHYDDDFIYIPGKDWDSINQCYPSEIEYHDYDYQYCDDGDIDDGFGGDENDFANEDFDEVIDSYIPDLKFEVKKDEKTKKEDVKAQPKEIKKEEKKNEEKEVKKEEKKIEENKDQPIRKSKLNGLFK